MTLQDVSYRRITDADSEFLFRVYASTRADEMKLTGWGPAQQEEFLRMQFQAQDDHYRRHYNSATFDIVLLKGVPIGRLYLDRRPDEIRIVDIALLPEYRGRGIGGAIVQEILNSAADEQLPVRIHVENNNPAQSLYQRLGFSPIGDTGVYLLLERSP